VSRTPRQLRWIHQNRPLSRPEAVGEIARKVVESQCQGGPAWRRGVFAMLEEHAGAELLQHIGGVDLRGGVLKLEVAEPAVAYHLRLQWEQRLLEVCQACLPAAGVHTVRFTARERPDS